MQNAMSRDRAMFRAYAPTELVRLIKIIAALKQVDLGEVLTEALHDWLQRPENKKLAEKHNLASVENEPQKLNS
jgi:hypothetical protein